MRNECSEKQVCDDRVRLAQHGVEHSFGYRPSKQAWMVRTRPKGSARTGRVVSDQAFSALESEWVYDLTVPGPQTFVDGVGQVLLHNTDSIVTNVQLPTSSALGALKDEYPGRPLTFLGIQPKVYSIEYTQDDEIVSKVTMKGFPSSLRTKENLTALIKGSNLTKEERASCDDGNHVWTELEAKTGKARRCEVCGTLAFTRLEKIRTLARTQFRSPPKMADVKKSLKSKYDKRVTLADGTTIPVVLDERDEPLFGSEEGEDGEDGEDEEGAAE